jgi:PHD/YefM family antitoxin component YafN of YafNO toxin-antitoxin module
MEAAIRPSADLRNHYSEISKQCKESREAVIITVNGRGDTAVLGLQDYYQMKSELGLLRTLPEDKRVEVIDFVEFLKKKTQKELELQMDEIIAENRPVLEELGK